MKIQLLFLASTTFFSDISSQTSEQQQNLEYVFYMGSSQEIELSLLHTLSSDENSAFSIARV